MKKFTTENRWIFLTVVVLLFVQSFRLDLTSPYKQPIAGDAQGYYAYLPAAFIYQDFDYEFVPIIQDKYYAESLQKSFVNEVNGEKVNKTFPGVAFFYLPFFLLAHVISSVFGLPADGYAYVYQLFFLVGFWFWFTMGLVVFKRVLRQLNFSNLISDVTTIVLVFGTNIYFYTVYDQSVTHIYNFFLVNLAVLLILKLKAEFLSRYLYTLLAVLAWIFIVRPTGLLVIFVLLFFVSDMSFYKRVFGELFRTKNILKTVLIPFLILAIPLLLWKIQTNSWIVYSYGEEGFNFLHPEIINFLFSFTKGWFLYTPIMLLIFVCAFILIWKKDKQKIFFALLFLVLSVYVFSSWWCWYYGAGMSQRVMIDFYILPGFLLATILSHLKQKVLKRSFYALTFMCMGLNVAQAYQISKGILPFGSPTKEQYFDNFLSFKRSSVIYPKVHWTLKKQIEIPIHVGSPFIIKDNAVNMDGQWMLETGKANHFSAVVRIPERKYVKGDKLIFKMNAMSEDDINESRIVFLFNTFTEVFYVKEFIHSTWSELNYMIEIDSEILSPVDIYLWNAGSGERLRVKDMELEVYFSEEYY